MWELIFRYCDYESFYNLNLVLRCKKNNHKFISKFIQSPKLTSRHLLMSIHKFYINFNNNIFINVYTPTSQHKKFVKIICHVLNLYWGPSSMFYNKRFYKCRLCGYKDSIRRHCGLNCLHKNCKNMYCTNCKKIERPKKITLKISDEKYMMLTK